MKRSMTGKNSKPEHFTSDPLNVQGTDGHASIDARWNIVEIGTADADDSEALASVGTSNDYVSIISAVDEDDCHIGACVRLTPTNARGFAKAILEAADQLEENR